LPTHVVAASRPEWQSQTLESLVQGRLPTDGVGSTALYDDALLAPAKLTMVSSIPLRLLSTSEPDALLLGVNADSPLASLMEQMQASGRTGGLPGRRSPDTRVSPPNLIVTLPRYDRPGRLASRIPPGVPA
jgi:hypothetical protein